MTFERIKQLSEEITADLFTDGHGREAIRFVMEFEGQKIDGTGLCQEAVAARVEKWLTSNLLIEP